MTPERWRQIEDLFHETQAHEPGARAAFLAEACSGDSDLRHEVESLLAQPDNALLRDGVAAVVRDAHAPGRHEGRAVGPYVLGPLLGAGGMGEVYRARDTKLGRDVAVKILPHAPDAPAGLADSHERPDTPRNAERLARFEREARVLAALSHPNIGAIYGLEESKGLRGLVLELVDGVTLKDRLNTGPLPPEEALAAARQIALALEAAHQKGIVHRDLTPANIKTTSGGVVKVLDFGLAKVDGGEAVEPAALPALATRDGVVLGTVAYMSPEQARGLAVDKRTDIWAFGCVLYEMLAGARPFPGESAADVLAAIVKTEPDWSRLPAATPRRIRDAIRRCLTKDPDRRLHDIADARIEIEDALAGPEAAGEAPTSPARHKPAHLPWVLSGVMAAAAAAAVWVALTRPSTDAPRPARLSIPLPAEVSVFAIGRGSSVAVSPDGQRIVFSGLTGARRQLYVRALDGTDSVPIAGTENGTNPFFSPDGRWIGFTDGTPSGSLKRVPVEGGAARAVVGDLEDGVPLPAVQSAWWGADDTILFASTTPRARGLWHATIGARPERVTTPREGELAHSWPQVLPGGTAVLYTSWNNTGFDGGKVFVRPMTAGDREPALLVDRASYGRVVADGRRAWLVYAQPEGLLAAPFDLERLRLAGPGAPVLDGVLVNLSGGAHFSASSTGVLAYVPGGLDELNKTAVWVSPDGTETEIGVVQGMGFQYRLSPDGRRLARPEATGPTRDLWIEDLGRRRPPSRLTVGAVVNHPVWTPDGRRLVYASGVPNANLHWIAADGSGPAERLATSSRQQIPWSISPDGTTLAYCEPPGAESALDIWFLPLRGSGGPRLVLGTPFTELSPTFSSDGRWLAYASNASGTFEIYLTPASGGGPQIPVSKGGGYEPMWSRDGRELYYRTRSSESAAGDMMAVAVDTSGPEPVIGTPRVLFPYRYQGNGDIGPDGRFLLLRPTPAASPSRVINVVLNWFEDLQERAPYPR